MGELFLSSLASTHFPISDTRRKLRPPGSRAKPHRIERNWSLPNVPSRINWRTHHGRTVRLIGCKRLPLSNSYSGLSFEHGRHLRARYQVHGRRSVSYLPRRFAHGGALRMRKQTGASRNCSRSGGWTDRDGSRPSRFQSSRSNVQGRENSTLQGTAALALRPLKSDRAALLFSYTHRSMTQSGLDGQSGTTDRSDTLSTDGLWQPLRDTELYGRFALKFGSNSREGLMPAAL